MEPIASEMQIQADALIDRMGTIVDAYIGSAFKVIDMMEEDGMDIESNAQDFADVSDEMDAVWMGFARIVDVYGDSTETFMERYGAAAKMTDLDILLDVLMEGGEPDVR